MNSIAIPHFRVVPQQDNVPPLGTSLRAIADRLEASAAMADRGTLTDGAMMRLAVIALHDIAEDMDERGAGA